VKCALRFYDNTRKINGGPWLTILELFRWVRSSQGFHTWEISRCSDSNAEHRAPVVDCTQVPFGNVAAKKRVRLGDSTLNELAFDGKIAFSTRKALIRELGINLEKWDQVVS
jgi:hypothetical protein